MATLPNVPPVPDQDRVIFLNSATPVSTIGVSFPVYGAQEDLTVIVNNAVLAASQWTFTSASGVSLSLLPLPVTDGVITFNAPQTGTILIVGNWQARQVIQPSAPGIARREFNQTVSAIISSLREVQRAIRLGLPFIQTDSAGDGYYSAQNDLVSNVADAVSSKDAVNLETMNAALADLIANGGTVIPAKWTLTGDGATSVFSIVPGSGLLVSSTLGYLVTANGLTMSPDTDYSISTTAQTITFTTPPANGAAIVVRMTGYARAVSNISTTAQAIAGTDDATYMSPLKVVESITNQIALWAGGVAALLSPTTVQAAPVAAQFAGSTAFGRLTLTSGVPVLTSTVSAAAIVLFTPYNGDTVPARNGSNFSNVPFAELSNVLANAATGNAGPAAAVANAVYDLFVWQATVPVSGGGSFIGTTTVGSPQITSLNSTVNLAVGQFIAGVGIPPQAMITGIAGSTVTMNLPATAAGTPTLTFTQNTLTRGPAWTNSTTRALALSRVQGVLVNSGAITNGPAAGYGVYVGTVMTDSGGATVTFNPQPAAASGGSAAWIGLWNQFQRRALRASVNDNKASWTYNSSAWRMSDNSAANRINFVVGEVEDAVSAAFECAGAPGTSGQSGGLGVGLNSATAPGGKTGLLANFSFVSSDASSLVAYPGVGANYLQALEVSSGGTASFYGTYQVGQAHQLSAELFY